MLRKIGCVITKVGAKLWENGGWTGEEQYNDLKLTGKLGYNLCVVGFKLMGITQDDLNKMLE